MLLPICVEELQHPAGQELELQSFRPTSRMDLFTVGNDFLDGRIAVRHFPRKGKHDDVLLDSQECNQLVSSLFFGVVGSAVGKNGSQQGKLCWMPETVTIFERKGLRVHVGHGAKRHQSQRSGVGAVTPVVYIATTLRFLDGQRPSILRRKCRGFSVVFCTSMNGAVCRVCSGSAAKKIYSDVTTVDVVGVAAQDREGGSAVVGDGWCTCCTLGVRLERKIEHSRSSNDVLLRS